MKLKLYILAFLISLGATAKPDNSESSKPSGSQSASATQVISDAKELADKAYAAERYEEAVKHYLSLTQQGEDANICYNLGNCYYRLDDIAHAILWYERAFLLSPGDGDIRHNLQLARSKTIDKIVPEEEIFFVVWYHSLLNVMSVNAWVLTGIILFALALSSLFVFFFSQTIKLRKIGFYGAIGMFLLAVCSNIFALQQHRRSQTRDRAIVLQGSVVVKSTPAQGGTDLFLLHAGTTMQILDNSMKEWYQIRLSDGKEGWIPVASIETI
ncbi:MAG: tetratricopeptide repeat protein [Bacteroidales bacterium]|nr:tetratricopeptide repeat protein [Candidatus Physcousia equi]